MKYILFLFSLFFAGSSFSQEKVAQIETDKNIKQSFNVVDTETGNYALFLDNSKSVDGYLFNKNHQKIAELKSTKLPSKFKTFIGYKIDNNIITVFMNTRNGRSYGVLEFNFDEGTYFSKEIDFKLKGEKYIESLSIGKSLYLFSIPKMSSQINIYEFKDSYEPVLNEVVFDKNILVNGRNKRKNLSELVLQVDPVSGSKKVFPGKVENGIPNALEVTSKSLKLYHEHKNVTFTTDYFKEFTYIININLNTYKHTIKQVSKPSIEGSLLGLKTNSFLIDNKLFQVISNTKLFKLHVFDLSLEKITKEISFEKNDPIDFKNTPIILEGGDFSKYRELDRTIQFLRKISESKLAISVYKPFNNYEITVGSSMPKSSGGFIAFGAVIGGVAGSIIVYSINPTTYSYNGYISTKSVRVTGLFNSKYEHIIGKVPQNPFDKIKDFYNRNKDSVKAQTIFKIENNIYYGYFHSQQEEFNVLKIKG